MDSTERETINRESRLRRSRIPSSVWQSHRLENFKRMAGNEQAWHTVCYYLALNDDLTPLFDNDESIEQVKWDAHDFLTLSGGPGRGKTHLAIGAGILELEAGEFVWYWQVERLLDALRRGYSDNNQAGELSYDRIMELCTSESRGAGLLILDDLGAQQTTEWGEAKLDEIVDGRYMNGLKTIFTTNLAPAQLSPRIASRLMEGEVALLTGIDFRELKRKKREHARVSPC
jgi:DNA replication protein DnaC